jgi:NADPH:quinone reductase-like Zn-dependent oxidoreductase
VAKPVGNDARQQAKNFDDRDLLVAVAQRRALSVVPRPGKVAVPDHALQAVAVDMMRVVTQDKFGGPEVLYVGTRPIPRPLPTEILVRVQAAGVNPVDWKTRAGKGMARILGEPPFVLGWDVCGVVDAVGTGVTRFRAGDEVYGMPWFPRQAGAYGEYVTAPSRHFAAKPTTLDHVQAGSMPLAALTAWQSLVVTAGLSAGDRVLVHAAAGGVGHLAVQIAKARGAYVIGTARHAKHQLLSDLGVDEPVDYTAVRFEDAVRDVDVVLDLVGGEYSLRSAAVLRPGGLLVSVPSVLPEGLADAAAQHDIRFTGILVEPDYAALELISDMVDSGQLRPLVGDSFPLDQAGKAHEIGEAGRNVGKIVLVV